MVDISEYKVGVIVSLEELPTKSGGKALRLCTVKVGPNDNDDDLVPVVTSAPNVREQSRVAVALAGSTVLTDDGEELKLTKTTVGGKMSHGMLCDSKMLGWSGGASGVAVQIPDDIAIGSSPPSSKPRPKGDTDNDEGAGGPPTGGLFERKLSKSFG
jgi:tRNA-binding EMAP/Myf-like protein